jgi:DNA mismatch repair protein MutS
MSTELLNSLPATPMMLQYKEIKAQYPAHLLLFRMGDFYELFADDAIQASEILSIALTMRQDKVPMCGIPHHALYNYVPKILKSGITAAICEQLEDPSKVNGRIVKRGVIRILTPGTIYEEELLGADKQARIASIEMTGEGQWLVLSCDLSTEKISIDICSELDLGAMILTNNVKEILCNSIAATALLNLIPQDVRIQVINDEIAEKNEFKSLKLANSSSQEKEIKISMARLVHYLKQVSGLDEFNWTSIAFEKRQFMQVDENCIRTLNLLEDQDGNKKHSLLATIDFCKTQPGKRALSNAICRPFYQIKPIVNRQNRVKLLMKHPQLHEVLRDHLSNCADLERIVTLLKRNPMLHHLEKLKNTLTAFSSIHESVMKIDYNATLSSSKLNEIEELAEVLNLHLIQELPGSLDERQFICSGISRELDEAILLQKNAQFFLYEFEEKLKKELNIQTMKIKYNKIYGYFVEVSKGAASKMPKEFQRRQTLVNSERYTCSELQALEEKILNARADVIRLNQGQFEKLINLCKAYTDSITEASSWLAELDLSQSLAKVALARNYQFPVRSESGTFMIKRGRHPIVEACFPDEDFVENDLIMNRGERAIGLITGPNMGGKSTFIRQAGLIQILFQIGSAAPVANASLPMVDRIFTRIGAFDRLTKGQSTFFVEMQECAVIFNHYSEDSLILLDEVGRGTSSSDGHSIAKAMLEFLSKSKVKPKVLFATHFAELAALSENGSGIFCLSVQVKERRGKVYFLHKITDGVCDQSYGVHVAKMAGIPKEITERAEQLLNSKQSPHANIKKANQENSQLKIF